MNENEALKQCKNLYGTAKNIVDQVREDNTDADNDTLREYASEQASGDFNVIYTRNATELVTDALNSPQTWQAFQETNYYSILVEWTREGRAADMYGSQSFEAGEIWDNLSAVAELLLNWAVNVMMDENEATR